MSYNRQKVSFEYETDWGLKAIISGKTEENEAFGAMNYQTLDKPFVPINSKTGNGEYLRTTEASFYVRYAPGETYINNKLRIFKRFWLNSWGKFDVDLKGGIEWDQVPYPLLIMPASNASFIIQKNTFSLINTMEFVNDRYVSLMLAWDMNGKILNRIPLAKKLYWREYLGVRMLWGDLSDKNYQYHEPQPAIYGNGGWSPQYLQVLPSGICETPDIQRPAFSTSLGHALRRITHILTHGSSL